MPKFIPPSVSATVLVLVAAIVGAGCELDLGSPLSGEGSSPLSPWQGESPVISSVKWTHMTSCSTGVSSVVHIRTVATDPDGDPSDLVYIGSVGRCTNIINSASCTIKCRNDFYDYSGTVTVTDPEGYSDTAQFSFSRCQDGEKTF